MKRAPIEGLGDVIARITHALCIDVLAEKIARMFGKEDCGCTRRRKKLNKIFPINKTTENK